MPISAVWSIAAIQPMSFAVSTLPFLSIRFSVFCSVLNDRFADNGERSQGLTFVRAGTGACPYGFGMKNGGTFSGDGNWCKTNWMPWWGMRFVLRVKGRQFNRWWYLIGGLLPYVVWQRVHFFIPEKPLLCNGNDTPEHSSAVVG